MADAYLHFIFEVFSGWIVVLEANPLIWFYPLVPFWLTPSFVDILLALTLIKIERLDDLGRINVLRFTR